MKVGVVGLGRWGRKVWLEYSELARDGLIDVIFGYDSNAAVEPPNGGVMMGTLDALIERVDAVHVATPMETHYDIARACLETDNHVLIEKPMTLKPTQAQELYNLAMARDRVLRVGHIYRYDPTIPAARQILGGLGRQHYARLQWTAHHERPTKQDIAWDLLPHPLDILHQIWGEWPTSFQTAPRSDECHAFITGTYSQGREAVFEISWLDHVRRRQVEIVCEDATLKIDLAERIISTEGQIVHAGIRYRNNTILDEAEAFVEAARHGHFEPEQARLGVDCTRSVSEAYASRGNLRAR